MSKDADPKPPATPESWRRPITWGRPPEQTFHVGPVPATRQVLTPEPFKKPTAAPPRPAQSAPLSGPSAPPAGNIFGGSLIPRARPQAEPARLPLEPELEDAPRFVKPEPEPEIEPAPVPEPDISPVVDPIFAQPDPPEAFAPPEAEREPQAEPELEPMPVVSPTLAAATARRKPSSRVPLYAGISVVAVLAVGVGGWLLTRPQPDAAPPATEVAAVPAATIPAPVVPEATPSPSEPVVARTPPPPATTTVPAARAAAAARPATTTVRPAPSSQTATSRPAPQPTTQAPPPAPAITPQTLEPAPPVTVPAPTAARPSNGDGDGPITTRPQALDDPSA